MKILFISDIVGKPGRRAVTQLLPSLKKELGVEFVVANLENLAHGKGVTASTLQEMIDAGVDAGTGGNHTFSKPEANELHVAKNTILIRPMNAPAGTPGVGQKTFKVGQKTVMVVNFMGEFGMNIIGVENPFVAVQAWWSTAPKADTIIVDIHAEATSEKVGFGWYLDGKVGAVLGTHTHIPTADARVLPKGTGYITDVGMVGLRDSSLGVDKDMALQRFLTGGKAPNEIPDHGLVIFHAVLLELEGNTCASIEPIVRTITV
jgi:metallophosphoesterase (TIGR00282 family)